MIFEHYAVNMSLLTIEVVESKASDFAGLILNLNNEYKTERRATEN